MSGYVYIYRKRDLGTIDYWHSAIEVQKSRVSISRLSRRFTNLA